MKTISKIVQNGKEYLIKEYEPRLVTTPGIYHNPELGIITVIDRSNNMVTIADKNLGATETRNGDGDVLTQANVGKMYQWGNNYGFDWNDVNSLTTSTTQVDASQYGPGNYYESSTFIIQTSNPYNWDSSGNYDLWGGMNGTNEDRQGPCPAGFHIPTAQEFLDLWEVHVNGSLGVNITYFRIYCKIPRAGLYKYDGTVDEINQYADFWTCCKNSVNTAYMSALYYSGSRFATYSEKFASALSIRPFKNEPVQPDESWIVLFQ